MLGTAVDKSKKKKYEFCLPTIGEVSEVFSAIKSSRPPRNHPRAQSSTLPRNDSKNVTRNWQSAFPEFAPPAEKSHFSCILNKDIPREGVRRVAQSATYVKRNPSGNATSKRLLTSSYDKTRSGSKEHCQNAGVLFVKAVEMMKPKWNYESFLCENDSALPDVNVKPDIKANLLELQDEEEQEGDDRGELSRSELSSHEDGVEEKHKSKLLEPIFCNLTFRRQNASSRPQPRINNLELCRKFSVKTFWENGSRHIWINITTETRQQKFKVGEIKQKTGNELGMEPGSLHVFGLFQGSLSNPTILLQDNEVVPEEDSHFCLMRACFNLVDERATISSDLNTMELIFWEVQSVLNSSTIYPPLNSETLKLLETLMEDADSLLCHLSLSCKKKFVETIIDLPFYSLYYYCKDGCCIREDHIMDEYNLSGDSELIIAMSEMKVTFIDKDKDKEVFSWPWNTIRGIKMVSVPKRFLEFEVQVAIDGKEFTDVIKVETSSSQYLFSISSYVITVHQNRLKILEDSDNSTTEVTNRIFKRCDNLFERRKNKAKKDLSEAVAVKKTMSNKYQREPIKKTSKKICIICRDKKS